MTRKDPLAPIRSLAPHVTDEQELRDRMKLHTINRETITMMGKPMTADVQDVLRGVAGIARHYAYGRATGEQIEEALIGVQLALQGLRWCMSSYEDRDAELANYRPWKAKNNSAQSENSC